jgi:hypothetical protein
VHHLAHERPREGEEVVRRAPQALQAREELAEGGALARVRLHEGPQLAHGTRRVRIAVGQPREVVGVVEPAQPVLEVDHVAWMVDHPGRVLRAHHDVEAGEVELGEAPVAVDELPEGALAARELDDLRLVGRVLVEVILQAPPQVLGPADRVGDRAGGHDGDVHGASQ